MSEIKFKDGQILPSRYRGPFRQEHYSVCSKLHRLDSETRSKCLACNAGSWHNVYVHKLDHLVYEHSYATWFWWHNRPRSKSRRTLEGIFPGLRSPKSGSRLRDWWEDFTSPVISDLYTSPGHEPPKPELYFDDDGIVREHREH
jgi:hypothetical protein